MRNVTYQDWLANESLREQIEREARRERGEAVYAYIVAPVMHLFRRVRQDRPAKTVKFRAA